MVNLLARFKQPEYTGEHRCIPCTALNLVIAMLGALVLVVVLPAVWTIAIAVGAGAFAVSVLVIYLRGYLIPGTPRLTKTYLPDRVLGYFDHHPTASITTDGDEIDLEATLTAAGVVQECGHQDDLCLTEEFRIDWQSRIRLLREAETTREDAASFLSIDPESLSFEDHDDAFVAHQDGRRLAQWESQAAFIADMAAVPELASRIREWSDLDVRAQSRMINGLRVFLTQCPACEGEVTSEEDRVESCCRSFDVFAMACGDCGARLFEAEVPASG